MSTTTHNVIETPRPRGRVGRAIATGLGGALIGVLLGLVVGANIGGNWFTTLELAGQRGYEATAMIGAVLGAVVLGAVGLWLGRGRRRR
jgi:uncharacterized membrane protein YeaQ/YmgE (transglycosylase-associated protein family)